MGELGSIIIGIFIGIIIYFIFLNRTSYHGINSKEVKKRIYKIGDKCYKLKPIVYICPLDISVIKP